MTEEQRIRQALLLLEESVPTPSRGVADEIFSQMIAELEATKSEAQQRTPERPRKRRLTWLRTRPAIAFGLAVLLIIGAASVLLIPRPRSALAVLQDAREKFKELPPYHAKTFVTADEDRSAPDFDVTWETEDWYASRTRFKSVVTASNFAAIGSPGTFRVSDGTLLGEYRADINVFTATPLDELDSPQDPAGFFNPSLQWWGSGTGEAKPSDRFFEENCTGEPGEYIGRKVTRLICPAEPRQIDLWVDDETGMLLRIQVFDVIREIRSIEFRPQFDASTFEVKPPEGAKKRWGGRGTPPPDYTVAIGNEVAARFQVLSEKIGGFQVAEVGTSGVWATVTRGGDGVTYSSELLRIDPRTGKTVASIKPSEPTFINDAVEIGRHLWVSFTANPGGEQRINRGWVQRVDLRTNKLIEPRFEMNPPPGRLAHSDGFVWTSGGKSRRVVVGRDEADFDSVSRIDTKTLEMTHLDLDGGAGSLVFHSSHLWVRTERFNRSGNDTEYFVSKVDPGSMRVVATAPLPHYPAGFPLVAGDRFIYTVTVDRSNRPYVVQLDPATAAARAEPASGEGGSVVFAGGLVWQVSFVENEVVKFDPNTLQIVGRMATGQNPTDIGAGLGSVWVTHLDGSLARIDVE